MSLEGCTPLSLPAFVGSGFWLFNCLCQLAVVRQVWPVEMGKRGPFFFNHRTSTHSLTVILLAVGKPFASFGLVLSTQLMQSISSGFSTKRCVIVLSLALWGELDTRC